MKRVVLMLIALLIVMTSVSAMVNHRFSDPVTTRTGIYGLVSAEIDNKGLVQGNSKLDAHIEIVVAGLPELGPGTPFSHYELYLIDWDRPTYNKKYLARLRVRSFQYERRSYKVNPLALKHFDAVRVVAVPHKMFHPKVKVMDLPIKKVFLDQ